MRLGETLARQLMDIGLVGRKIRVEQTFSDGVVNTPKSGHGRTVEMSTPLADTLKRLEMDRKAETLKKGWRDVAWYLVKYIGKDIDSQPREFEEHRYFWSLGIAVPTEHVQIVLTRAARETESKLFFLMFNDT